MADIRIIHMMFGDDLQSEQIEITDELDTPAGDFLPPGFKIVSDIVHDIDLPDSFPLNSSFKKFA